MPTVVCWGGLDPGAQAGLAADLEAAHGLGAQARLVLTARTAQADGRWIQAWAVADDEVRTVSAGLDLPAHFAVKTGMLATLANLRQCLAFCRTHSASPLVVDPLWQSSSGGWLWLDPLPEVRAALLHELLPIASVVTPNWLELQWLAGSTLSDLGQVGKALAALPCPAVLKGGHAPDALRGIDWVWDGSTLTPIAPDKTWLQAAGRRQGVRGTGCRFATALAVGLANGQTLLQATAAAKTAVAAYALRQLA